MPLTCTNGQYAPIARNSDNQLSERSRARQQAIGGPRRPTGPSVPQPARRPKAQTLTFCTIKLSPASRPGNDSACQLGKRRRKSLGYSPSLILKCKRSEFMPLAPPEAPPRPALRLVRAGCIHGQRKSDDVPLQVGGKLHPHSIGKSFGYRQAQARSVTGTRRVRPIESVEQRRRID